MICSYLICCEMAYITMVRLSMICFLMICPGRMAEAALRPHGPSMTAPGHSAQEVQAQQDYRQGDDAQDV